MGPDHCVVAYGDGADNALTIKAEHENEPDSFVLIVIVNIFSAAAVLLVGLLLILVG